MTMIVFTNDDEKDQENDEEQEQEPGQAVPDVNSSCQVALGQFW